MALVAPLSPTDCRINVCEELGPAQLILTPYCRDNEDPIIIKCSEQRDDLEVMSGLTYVDVPNQCSQRPKKLGSSSKMQINVSLGCGSTRPEVLAALFGTEVVTDPLDSTIQSIVIKDRQGATPDYWQVEVQPLVNGLPSESWDIIMFYGYTVTEDAQFIFSPSKPRAVKFLLMAELHPTLGELGRFNFKN